MESTPMNAYAVRELVTHFTALQAHVPLKAIRTAQDYEAAVKAMNALLDAGAGDESHPLADLVAAVGALVGDYDDRHFPREPVSEIQMLKFLMDQHRLTQSDLPEIGSQGVVSEILRGKRKLNVRQIRALKQRFGIDVAALF